MKFWSYVSISIIVSGVFGSVEEEWSTFKLEHKKSYPSDEEEKRFCIFKTNLAEINEHNKNYEKGLVTYQKQINKYGDLTAEEFLDMYKLYFRSPVVYNDTLRPNANTIPVNDRGDKGSESFDWREKGAVTPAKDQGGCGACWIFSSVGLLEGYYFRSHKKLLSFSEQNMVDCISNSTCLGGWAPLVLYYVQRKGIHTEEDYPYEAKHVKCRQDPSKYINITFTNIVHIDPDENKIKTALANFGPIGISICATSQWRFYSSGVWYEKKCCEWPNHAVLLVGYGREKGQDYWVIKNSMGTSWGDNGFIKLARNKHKNYCSLPAFAYYIN